MRRIARTDANQQAITDALRAVGCTILHLHELGQGAPDICVGLPNRGDGPARLNLLLEIKDGSKPPSARRLTADEAAWHENWRGQVAVVCSVEEALQVVGVEAK